MKVALASDLHIEFGNVIIKNDEHADVLILAGDVMVAQSRNSDKWARSLFGDVSSRFKDVIYIAGNHESYHGDIKTTDDILRKYVEPYGNIHYLSNDMVHIGDTVFFGGTLWTDMDKQDELTMHLAGSFMNDYSQIRSGTRRLSVSQTLKEHEYCLAHLEGLLELYSESKIVVVTHHGPSKKSIHPKYANSPINGAYTSDLEYLMLNNPNIALWCHGHTHLGHDYTVGSTRVVCNPRGYYGIETDQLEFKPKFMEI